MTYPVTTSPQDIVDGLNYVLSGPGGLGQSFAGFSSYDPQYLSGNYRIPYTKNIFTSLYVAPVALSLAEVIDDRTIKYTFASAQPTPPFRSGNGLSVTGITPAGFNSTELKNAGTSIYQIGVVVCTTTYVIVRTVAPIVTPIGTYVSGGSITYTSTDTTYNSTDCDVRVTILGGQERVFVSGQLDQAITFDITGSFADIVVTVAIRRYTGFQNDDPTNPDFIFDDPVTIVAKDYAFTLTADTTRTIETVFSNAIDNPDPGYYRYILEVYFGVAAGTAQATSDILSLRSISAQVIKP